MKPGQPHEADTRFADVPTRLSDHSRRATDFRKVQRARPGSFRARRTNSRPMNARPRFITRGRDLLEWHARQHGVSVAYIARHDPQEGRAGIHGIRLPAPTSVESLLTFAHELGHQLAPPCPGSAPHLRVQHDRHTACIVCEVNAWTKAFELIPFTEAMARSAAQSLKTHLRSTPATDEAKRRVECFMRLEQWRHQQDLDEFARETRELEAEGLLSRKGQNHGKNR